ncbi:MAG: sugar diacid recognition domain-containing protein, partial [Mediterraneibacter gnavus]
SLAEKLIEQVTKYTSYNVNIMNEQGVIIASRNPERIGKVSRSCMADRAWNNVISWSLKMTMNTREY